MPSRLEARYGMRPIVPPPSYSGSVGFLYFNPFGRILLKLVSARWVSRLAGKFLDSSLSKPLIKRFIKKHHIDMSQFVPEEYNSFNAFFTRKIDPALRPFDGDENAVCSPCDGAASVFRVTEEGTFCIKGFDYTVKKLLGDEELAKKFYGGLALILRLTVSDYHRYNYLDDGTAEKSKFIKGKLHTVRPAALEKKRVYTENCREVTLLQTKHLGCVAQVEVGAMFVGRIVNENKPAFSRGEEKGRFEYGGSTIVLLFEKDKVTLDYEFFENTAAKRETKVLCGEKIGLVNGKTAEA